MSSQQRPAVVLLHGANASGSIMRPLADALRPHVEVFAPDLLGHGGRPVPERLTIEALAADVLVYLDSNKVNRTFVFGFSSGGSLALYLARHFPQRVIGVATLAAKYVFDKRTIAHWTHLTDPERLGRPGNKRAQELTETHQPQNWIDVTNNNRRMFEEFGRKPPLSEADLRAITVPAILFSSDQDQIVPLEEVLALGKLIPDARTVIFRGQCHPFSVVPFAAMSIAIRNWMDDVLSRSTSSNPQV